jgi:hypothetical protein
MGHLTRHKNKYGLFLLYYYLLIFITFRRSLASVHIIIKIIIIYNNNLFNLSPFTISEAGYQLTLGYCGISLFYFSVHTEETLYV